MRFTVSKKILSGFGILIILITTLGILSINKMSSINDNVINLYEKQVIGIDDIKEANIDIVSRGREAVVAMIDGQDHTQRMELIEKDFLQQLNSFKDTLRNEEDKAKVTDIVRIWEEEIKPLEIKANELNKSGNRKELSLISNSIKEKTEKLEAEINSLSIRQTDLAKEAYEESVKSYATARIVIISTIIAALIVGLGVGLYISREISKPLTSLNNAVGRIADGDLTTNIQGVNNKDEIGELAESFGKMARNLKEVIGQVVDASQKVAASSEELSASSQATTAATEQVANTISELSTGANKQAEDVENTSVIVNQISANIQQAAANSETVSQSSLQVLEIASKGVQESENAVDKIQRIKEVAGETAEVVKKLGEESEKIGQIVDVIKGIADQTNLLALNAAIEAARAGEQGRGFAVVAEEVRKLAEQSSGSAQQISELISNIQKETARAVGVMENGTQEVADGVTAVNKAGESFKNILMEIDHIVEQIQQVSSVTNQIAIGSTDVVKSIDSIAAIAEETAASSQEVTAAAEEQTASMEEIANSSQELAELAEDLIVSVSKFKL